MHDDAWYAALVPSARSQEEPSWTSKHQRRESLLKQVHENDQADSGHVEEVVEQIVPPPAPRGPPTATIARRAQSYSDFYDAARAQSRKDASKADEGWPGLDKEMRTELDFSRYYGGVEEALLDAEDEEYQLYRDSLVLSQSHLDALLRTTSTTLDLLSSLSQSFRSVDAQTTTVRAQCQEVLSEQQRLAAVADGIETNLQYYNYLEPITKRLNAPGAGRFVRGPDFSEMLSSLDHCIAYMAAHPTQREAQTYHSRYRLLLTRALTLVRVHFATSLREIAADVTRRIADRQLNETTMSALLYAKFRVGADELKRVGMEIQKRASSSSASGDGSAEAECQSLMNELYQSYTATRGKLVIPLARKKMGEIAMAPSTAKDLVAFARSSMGYVRGVCLDECELWGEWFEGEAGLYEFLEFVVEPLYDHLRPRIIRENDLPKLCELCTLIQTRYLHDQDEDADSAEVSQLDFAALIQPVLEDAQTRLVFRTQAILRDEIERYRPKPEDVDYPACNHPAPTAGKKEKVVGKTSGRKASLTSPTTPVPSTPVVVDEDSPFVEGRGTRWDLDAGRGASKWYPTLRKAIWLLSRIYRLVNSTVFDDLAHQIVHQTTLSLHQAATLISGKATAADGQLFLMKHLLILKSQIVAFDIEFITPEVAFDFSSVTGTFWELRERGGLFNPRTLVQLMSGSLLPRVVENMLDAKAELDARLRAVITDFTHHAAGTMTLAIAPAAAAKRGFRGGVAVATVREATEREIVALRRKLDEYLDDARTRETLVAAVQDQVVQSYDDFHRKYATDIATDGKAASKKGKGREDEVWDVDTFADWTAGVFGVGREGLRETDESRSRSMSRSGSI